ncbi:universal stress protein [Lysobacter sp. N42]|jgi:nucleotide-binding universal stress UspA family protein|uniref:universal stress protein n=1 Tax=Lysobacter sp. N42 TaxID=2545719 RepID=UPI001404ADED|nr:universal stress protein [Lysobacter sp. N42]
MQDVLVRIVDPANFEREARPAARIAAGLGGSLTALHAVPIGVPPPSLYDPGLALAEWATCAEREVRDARGKAAAFQSWAQAMGVANATWTVGAGHVPDLIAQAGAWNDLVVLRRGGPDAWSSPDGIARIVLGSGLPGLVLPPAVEPELPVATVAIAWNGSAEAIRAVHAAGPLLARAHRVVVLAGTPQPRSALAPEFHLQPWLEARAACVVWHTLEGEAQTGAGLLDAAAGCGADLLVMGAYGRSRASEWLLGGVTRHVLQHAALPVLMRH